MRTPLSVYVLYHTENKEGSRIYSELYSLLCRDVNNPFLDGLDIPVYFVTGNDEKIIKGDLSATKKKLFLVFIDINMFCSEKWASYIKELTNKVDDNTLVVGVKQYRHSFSINKKLGETQSIVVDINANKDHILMFEGNNWAYFTTQLYDLLIRFISNKEAKQSLSIFISHSKRDRANKGELMAKEVRDFLYSDTKLNSFFDVHDILDGYKFGDQITTKIGSCSLLILFTDTYSSREWCRKEALIAKDKHIPIVAVFMLDGNVDRVFPYIGNVPSTVFDGDWRKVINLLLRTMLDQSVEAVMLEEDCDENTEFLPYPPEAYNMSLLKDETRKLLYPEPPLGNEELDVLKHICEKMHRNIVFCTPMSHLTENINLGQKNIAISISESTDLPALGIGEELYKDLTIEITRHLLKANGKLIYGGDLRTKGYTELFKELSNQYGQLEKAETDVIYIQNYLSWPLFNNVTLEQKADYLNSRIKLVASDVGEYVQPHEISDYLPPSSLENRLKWASSLSKMRCQMVENSIARIVVGGKTKGFTGYMAGVVEECKIALESKQPVFIVGAFGGAAHMLSEVFEKKAYSKSLLDKANEYDNYKELYDWCEKNDRHINYEFFDSISITDLNNGLTEVENTVLFHSVDVIEIVSLILKGLNNINNNA